MDKLIRALNIGAFCCSVAAVLLIVALASGMSAGMMDPQELNRTISNLVAGYCCCYGLSQWFQKMNPTLAIGLMVIGTLIFSANIMTGKL